MFSRVCFTARSMVLAVSTIALVPIRWEEDDGEKLIKNTEYGIQKKWCNEFEAFDI